MIDYLKKKIKQFKNSKYLSSYLLNSIFAEINDILSIFEKNVDTISNYYDKVKKMYDFTLGIITYEIEKLFQIIQTGKFYKLDNPSYLENVVVAEDALFLQPDMETIVPPIGIKEEKYPESESILWVNDSFHKLTIKNDAIFVCKAYSKYDDDVYYKLIYNFNKQHISRIYVKAINYQEVELYVNGSFFTKKSGINILFVLDGNTEIDTIELVFRTMPYESIFKYPITKDNINKWLQFLINKLRGKETKIHIEEGEKVYVYDYSLDYIEFIDSHIYDYKKGSTFFTFRPRGAYIDISGVYNDPQFGIVEAYIEYNGVRYYLPFADYVGRVFNRNELSEVYNYYEEEIIGEHIKYENCALKDSLIFDIDRSVLILKNRREVY